MNIIKPLLRAAQVKCLQSFPSVGRNSVSIVHIILPGTFYSRTFSCGHWIRPSSCYTSWRNTRPHTNLFHSRLAVGLFSEHCLKWPLIGKDQTFTVAVPTIMLCCNMGYVSFGQIQKIFKDRMCHMGTTVSKVAVKLAHKLTTHDGSTHTHSPLQHWPYLKCSN